MNTTSASGSTASNWSGFTNFFTIGVNGLSSGSTPITVIPNAQVRVAICIPIPPTPITTAVQPFSSMPGYGRACKFSYCLAAQNAGRLRVSASSMAKA